PASQPEPALMPEPLPGGAPGWPPAAERRSGGAGFFLKLLYWLFAIVIGIPLMVVLAALGLPFLSAGIYIIYSVIQTVPRFLGIFTLFSDTLLLAGGGLVAMSLGLVVAWFGLWLSISLCRFWISRVLLLGGRVMGGEES
ncbi:MAG: hypothetical protein IJ617_04765, partial [Oscillospiraceae bacterium]|nr:hypothetical protein [Oscillospiraceae bacterium]